MRKESSIAPPVAGWMWYNYIISYLTMVSKSRFFPSRDNCGLGRHWLDQYGLRQWLAAWWHQAITWTNGDLSSVRTRTIHLKEITLEMALKIITKTHLGITHLTHWGLVKIVAISQTIFSNAFSWMEMYEFRLQFSWSLFLRFELAISQNWFR